MPMIVDAPPTNTSISCTVQERSGDNSFTIANIDRVEVVNEVLELHPEASILV